MGSREESFLLKNAAPQLTCTAGRLLFVGWLDTARYEGHKEIAVMLIDAGANVKARKNVRKNSVISSSSGLNLYPVLGAICRTATRRF